MNHFLPEGMGTSVHTMTEPREALLRAIGTREILEAPVVCCDEAHNLTLELGGGLRGILPREEAAMGIREGTVREVAILSKVGQTVCFHVEASCGEEFFRLSRRSVQQEAMTWFFANRVPGDIIPAIVTCASEQGAFCDVGCGLTALMGLKSISVSRSASAAERFSPGDRIFAVIRHMDPACGRIYLSHRELLGTWEENARLFRTGQTVTGTVRNVQDYGVFIELTPNLTGLAEPTEALQPGDAVSVYIKSIQPEKAKIKLAVVRRLPRGSRVGRPMVYHRTEGHLSHWQYGPDTCPKLQSVFLTSSQ